MNVKIETHKDAGGWLATCGSVVVRRPRKADAVAALKQAVLVRLSADTRMPRVVPAVTIGRAFVVMPDLDGGTLVLNINTETGRMSGIASDTRDLDEQLAVYQQHVASQQVPA